MSKATISRNQTVGEAAAAVGLGHLVRTALVLSFGIALVMAAMVVTAGAVLEQLAR
jgi:hypothetical protein